MAGERFYTVNPFERDVYWMVATPDLAAFATFATTDDRLQRITFFEQEDDARRYAGLEGVPEPCRGRVTPVRGEDCAGFLMAVHAERAAIFRADGKVLVLNLVVNRPWGALGGRVEA